MSKILVTNASFGKYSEQAVATITADYEMVRPAELSPTAEDLLKYVDDQVVGIICGLEPITKQVMDKAPNLKVVGKHGAGVDNIDLEAAKAQGVAVVNAPGTNAAAVADLVFALMLDAARMVTYADKQVRAVKWPKVFGKSLSGRTLGIIGLGGIGKLVAKRALGFDMTVVAYDQIWDEAFARQNDIRFMEIADILKQADFLTLHIPLNDQTRNMIGRKELQSMKKNAILINTSRGGVVDETALFEALQTGVIAAAGLDVFAEEPPQDSPLFALDNVVVTPHMGGFSDGALGLTSEFIAQAVVDILQGAEVKYRVV